MMRNVVKFLLLPFAIAFRVFELPSLKLGSPFGVPFEITKSFIVWAAILGWMGGLELLTIIIMAYVSVTIHEYGHALVAKRFGYKALKVALWPMSGLATIDGDFTNKPGHEFWISVAGPITNLIQSLLLLPFIFLGNKWLNLYFEINVIIFLFNLIPVYPMDGGRLLHSFIASRSDSIAKISLWTSISILVMLFIAVPITMYYWNVVSGMMLLFIGLIGLGEQRARMEKERLKIELSLIREKFKQLILKGNEPLKKILELDLEFCDRFGLPERAEKVRELKDRLVQIEATLDDPAVDIPVIKSSIDEILDEINETLKVNR